MVLSQDIPAGPGAKNLPADAEDTGSIPSPGRSHMPQSRKACVPTTEACVSRACASQQEKPPQMARTPHTQRQPEKAHTAMENGTAKNK